MKAFACLALSFALAFTSLVPESTVAWAERLSYVTCVTQAPPHVPGATTLQKRYAGQRIIFYAGETACAQDLDTAAIHQFTVQTGIAVKVVEAPAFDPKTYVLYKTLFSHRSRAIDVVNLDVTWPGAFAPHLRDLTPTLGREARTDYQSLVANDTVHGRLVAMPLKADFGMLYYRADLLRKYHLPVPKTWTELGTEAKIIQHGERPEHPSFFGYVFQGSAYEGLSCDALEWIASSGGGNVIDNGKVTLNNARAAQILNLVRSWVGTIVPRDITKYTEDTALAAFTYGNAAFMRNWPYAWSVLQQSKLRAKTAVAALPALNSGRPAGTAGCCELGVSAYSQHPGAATELVRYLTGASMQIWRATSSAQEVPVSPSVTGRADVLRAMPFLMTAGKDEQRVARPSRYLGVKYDEASAIFWTGIGRILTGTPAQLVLPKLARQLRTLVR